MSNEPELDSVFDGVAQDNNNAFINRFRKPQVEQPQVVTAIPRAKSKQKIGEFEIPHSINIEGFDIENPPGLAGDIVRYMREGAYRPLENGGYTLSAVWMMCAAAGAMRGIGNTRLNLIAITLGVSAGGKERPQEVAKEALGFADISINGSIRTDKDIIRAIVANRGRCTYINDEAHVVLMAAKKDGNQRSGVADLMTELTTSGDFIFPEIYKDEYCEKYEKQLVKIGKQLEARELELGGYNEQYEQEKIARCKDEIEKIKVKAQDYEERIHEIMTGFKSVSFNSCHFSTPKALAEMIDEDMIEKGLMGRGLFIDCGSFRHRGNEELVIAGLDGRSIMSSSLRLTREKVKHAISKIVQISNDETRQAIDADFNGVSRFTITPIAREKILDIWRFYEQDEYLNHPRLGALFARLYQRVAAVARVLSLGDMNDLGQFVINEEHVVYALTLVLHSNDCIMSNLKVNEGAEGDAEDQRNAIKETIIRHLSVKKGDSREGWRYESEIRNVVKRRKFYEKIVAGLKAEGKLEDQNPFESCVGDLVRAGKIILSEDKKQLKLNK